MRTPCVCRASCAVRVPACAVHVSCMCYAYAVHICHAKAAMRSYRDARTREAEPPPHSFAVAERVYRTLLEASSGAAQSVVVSGESLRRGQRPS